MARMMGEVPLELEVHGAGRVRWGREERMAGEGPCLELAGVDPEERRATWGRVLDEVPMAGEEPPVR